MSDFDDLRAELGEEFITAEDFEQEMIPTGNLRLDNALNGGLATGQISLLYGTSGSGKTSVALSTVANAQERGKTCVWFDAEKGFDKAWARKHGVDTGKLLVQRNASLARVFDNTVKALKQDVGVIVIDSVNALVPGGHMADDEETKRMNESHRLGSLAADMSTAVPRLVYYLNNTLVILISQIRQQNKGTFWTGGFSGGNAVDFYPGQRVKFWAGTGEKALKTGKVFKGDKVIEKTIGRTVTYSVEKNRYGPPFVSGHYDFYFDGEFIGPDNIGSIVDDAVERGVIKKAGAWFKFDGEVVAQGRDNTVDAVRNDPEFRERLEELTYG